MIKIKKILLFFKRKIFDEDEKNVSTSTKFEKLRENLIIGENEKNSLKLLELYIINLKIL